MLSHFASAQCSVKCTLLWQDEFDGSAVDESKWEFQYGTGASEGLWGWGNNELQYYRDSNASVANGLLTITAKRENFYTSAYTSSRLRTKNKAEWTYGRIEMRAKLPAGEGLWPAFWMLPTDSPYGSWPSSGEIDIMESKGSDPDLIYGTIHFGTDYFNRQYTGGTYRLATSASENFYTYAVEWAPNEIRWYIEDEAGTETLFKTVNNWLTNEPYPAPFDSQFHLLLNLAVGGNFVGNPANTAFPKEFAIDYVRVYRTEYTLPEAFDDSTLLIDDMNHGAPSTNNWFTFDSDIGGGVISGINNDLPPTQGGTHALKVDYGSNNQNGYIGGFGKTIDYDTTGMGVFELWINPSANQHYSLEINIQDDDNADGAISQLDDEEYQYVCEISATGPCAIAGGGWQLISIPLKDFNLDNSYFTGGNGQLDTADGGNGNAEAVAVAVINQGSSDVNFVTDQWQFKTTLQDQYVDIPVSLWAQFLLGLSLTLISLKRPRR